MEVIEDHATALERVYREEGARLWRAVYAYARDRSIADDAVAEAFAQALGRGDEIRDPARWVWAAAFKIAKGSLARRQVDGSETEGSYELPDPSRDVVDALGALSPKQRASVLLHHYAGYSVKEVASMIGSTNAAVRVHLSQGRKRLRSLLEEHDA